MTKNPAMVAERASVEVVQSWVGDLGRVQQLERGDRPDFEIAYTDGRRGVGEVKLGMDTRAASLWDRIRASTPPHVVALPSGSGTWSATLAPDVRLRSVERALPSIIRDLLEQDLTLLEVYAIWPPGDMAASMRRLGIRRLAQVEMAGDPLCSYFVEGIGGAVPATNGLGVWAEAKLREARIQASLQRLLNMDVHERHVFLWLLDDAPVDLRLHLALHDDVLPQHALEMPRGITHLWASSFGNFTDRKVAWLYRAASGWEAVTVDGFRWLAD